MHHLQMQHTQRAEDKHACGQLMLMPLTMLGQADNFPAASAAADLAVCVSCQQLPNPPVHVNNLLIKTLKAASTAAGQKSNSSNMCYVTKSNIM
jgi:hypothetical protein